MIRESSREAWRSLRWSQDWLWNRCGILYPTGSKNSWIGEVRYWVYRTECLYDSQLVYARPTRNCGIVPPMMNQRRLHVFGSRVRLGS